MPKKSVIYTKAGDKGETSLLGGERVKKSHPRVRAYGAVDELNAALGVAASFAKNKKIERLLQNIQNELLILVLSFRARRKRRTTLPGIILS